MNLEQEAAVTRKIMAGLVPPAYDIAAAELGRALVACELARGNAAHMRAVERLGRALVACDAAIAGLLDKADDLLQEMHMRRLLGDDWEEPNGGSYG